MWSSYPPFALFVIQQKDFIDRKAHKTTKAALQHNFYHDEKFISTFEPEPCFLGKCLDFPTHHYQKITKEKGHSRRNIQSLI